MSKRKKKHIDLEDNDERWMVSYADFVTLLFAFFVVMYSISSVNEGKYKTLSDSLEHVFPKKISSKFNPIELDSPSAIKIKPIKLEQPTEEEINKHNELSEEILKERRRLGKVTEDFKEILEPFIDQELISVKNNDFWVELEMNSELLFASGEATLSAKAQPVLRKISQIVRRMPNVINVEGYTDNVPIETLEFPSNWDLSSARATTVVREFINLGINPNRLSAIGYGEFHPVADNSEEAGRYKNRRVTLVLMSQAFARYGTNDEERARLLNLAPSKGEESSFTQNVY